MTQKHRTPDGLVIVDKPSGFTSHDVVAKMRGIAKTRRVGHAGTLDPMATGVLVLGVEKATKLLGHLALTEKEYLGTIRLGQNTLTDDAEGDITSSTDASGVKRDAVDAGIAKLTGDIMQVPSKVSAIKINGVRSYKRARDGEDFEIPARPVRISSFAVYDIRDAVAEDGTPVLDLVVSVVCSSGTYIRALARDLGADLGVGGHLTALRRTRVGPYKLDSARTLDQLQEELTVMPIAEAAAAAFPRWDVDARRAQLLLNGVRLEMPEEYAGRGRRRRSSTRRGGSWRWWRSRRARRRAWRCSADAVRPCVGRPDGRLAVERRSRGLVPAAPRSPLGSPTQGSIHPPSSIHPFGQALGVKRGSGRGRVRQAICPADHLAPTVGSRSAAGRFEHGGTGPADRGPTCTGRQPTRTGPRAGRYRTTAGRRRTQAREADDEALVRICDLAGRPRGTGFVADHHGTVITSHEAVDGLGPSRPARPRRPHLRGHRRRRHTPARTPIWRSYAREGLGVDPLPVTVRDPRRDRHVRPDRRGRLARGAGARRLRRHVHGDRPLPSPRRRPGVGDRYGRRATRCGWAAGPPGGRSSTPRPGRWSRSWAPRCTPGTGLAGFAVPLRRPLPPTPEGRSPRCWPATRRRCPRTGPISIRRACWS